MTNWFGLTKGTLIGEPPAYVDKSRRPGSSEIPKATLTTWLMNAPLVLLATPNFVWACIALLLYNWAPYSLGSDSAAALAPLSVPFFTERFPLWLSVTAGYTGAWHAALYLYNGASRPFIPHRPYNLNKVLHNVFWTTSGIAIWTAFENVVCYLWATNRLLYRPDADSFGTLTGLFAFLVALGGVPLWRSVHFYFAHRFLHFDALYKQVHSLHHRNTDVEPFSGLCMHPVEHLYYFACVGPSLILYCSPFAFLWNGVHLLLSPAASHSGYEDHFQSDAFHYIHHRYFECNYAGTDANFLDVLFGTFKGSMDEEGEPAPREDAKSTLQVAPTPEFLTYLGGSLLCGVPWWLRSTTSELTVVEQGAYALLAGTGPVLLAPVVSHLFGSRRGVRPVRMSSTGNLLHILLGTLFCAAPIVYALWLTLQPGA
jgi:sterol desaturase/sphingolipid hydroxylase (fatty acid hydroxylase superfamily)